MKSKCFSPAARIHICLGLFTMGYQQELAVKIVDGKRTPVQPVDICSQTGLRLKHFREYMACLEAAGLARCEGSTKGRVNLYAWAVPKPVEASTIVPRAGTIFEGCPPELGSLLNHYRVRFAADFVPRAGTIDELNRLAREAKEAETSLREYVKGLAARSRPNKEERNERNSSSSAPVEVVEGFATTTAAVPNPEQEPERLPQPPPTSEPEPTAPKPPPETPPAKTTAEFPTFHRELCRRFRDSGKRGVPTDAQARQIYDGLGRGTETEFLDFLTPQKLRPIIHPGALPYLLGEFRVSVAAEPPPALTPPPVNTGMEELERMEALDRRVQGAWAALSENERMGRLDNALKCLRGEARFGRISREKQELETERYAMDDLRRELEEGAAAAAAGRGG
jgi:hypothetical protein